MQIKIYIEYGMAMGTYRGEYGGDYLGKYCTRSEMIPTIEFIGKYGIAKLVKGLIKKMDLECNSVCVKVKGCDLCTLLPLTSDRNALNNCSCIFTHQYVDGITTVFDSYSSNAQIIHILDDLLSDACGNKDGEVVAIILIHEALEEKSSYAIKELEEKVTECRSKNIKLLLLGMEDETMNYDGLERKAKNKKSLIDVSELKKYSSYPDLCFKSSYEKMCIMLEEIGYIISNPMEAKRMPSELSEISKISLLQKKEETGSVQISPNLKEKANVSVEFSDKSKMPEKYSNMSVIIKKGVKMIGKYLR